MSEDIARDAVLDAAKVILFACDSFLDKPRPGNDKKYREQIGNALMAINNFQRTLATSGLISFLTSDRGFRE